MSDGNVFFLCEATLTSRKFATKWFFSRVSLCMLRKETLMGEALSTWMKLVMKKCFLPCGFESDVTNYVLVKAPEMISLVPLAVLDSYLLFTEEIPAFWPRTFPNSVGKTSANTFFSWSPPFCWDHAVQSFVKPVIFAINVHIYTRRLLKEPFLLICFICSEFSATTMRFEIPLSYLTYIMDCDEMSLVCNIYDMI